MSRSCPHGILNADQFNRACDECNAESDARKREMNAARAFRARVVVTARALLIGLAYMDRADADTDIGWALGLAEKFERAADGYEKTGEAS